MKRIVETTIRSAMALAIFVAVPALAQRGESVFNTPHNLSAGGGAHNIKASTPSNVQGRVCVFCHTPHHSTAVMPLWSRDLSAETYTLYRSDSMVATVQQPRGASRLCLSCHDGTIALGLLARGYVLDATLKSFDEMPPEPDPRRNPNLGTDLVDDHPVSFQYTLKAELQDPVTLQGQGIKLEQDTWVECTSCHTPHNNLNGNFLVLNVDDEHDRLCTTCHLKTGWTEADTAHRTGGGRYPAVQAQVAADGCISCHLPHSSPGHITLQKGANEENTCALECHRAAPYRDIPAEFAKMYRHPVTNFPNNLNTYPQPGHKVGESLPVASANEHVECVDCHNPHRAGYEGAPMGTVTPAPGSVSAPAVSGVLRGVRVDNAGKTADYEYEICFKCHSGSYAEDFADTSALRPLRQYSDFDEAERFAPGNPSYHPVMADRPVRADAGRSLKAGLQASMTRIYCIDCHSPHGADEPHILVLANDDTFPAISADYQLCFSCHNSVYLFTEAASATLHSKHVQGPHDSDGINPTLRAPCAACHDPHGIPGSLSANPFLINFDTRWSGIGAVYDHLSAPKSCTVDCHTTGSPDPKTHTY